MYNKTQTSKVRANERTVLEILTRPRFNNWPRTVATKWRFIEGLLFARHAIPYHSESASWRLAHSPAIHRYEQKYECPFRELLACSHSYAECTHSDYTGHSGKNKRGSAAPKARLQLVAILSTIAADIYEPSWASGIDVATVLVIMSYDHVNYYKSSRVWCIVSRPDAKWKSNGGTIKLIRWSVPCKTRRVWMVKFDRIFRSTFEKRSWNVVELDKSCDTTEWNMRKILQNLRQAKWCKKRKKERKLKVKFDDFYSAIIFKEGNFLVDEFTIL